MIATSLYAKSFLNEVQAFMGGTLGMILFISGCILLMLLGFKLMKMLDNSVSYQHSSHPPR